jgi:hypothetical protein
MEIEGSSEKGCCKKIFKFSGAGFEDAQSTDVLVQLIERPSFIRIAAMRGKHLMRLSAVVLKLMSSI